jgi:hypothetical protein
MALEGPARRLHDEIKYRRKFPPREAAALKKSELAMRGLGRSGTLIAEISRLYADAAEAVIEEFLDTVRRKGVALGIVDEADALQVIAEAHQQTFDEARGLLLNGLMGQIGDYRTLATGVIDDRRRPIGEHLERKLELQKLEIPASPVTQKGTGAEVRDPAESTPGGTRLRRRGCGGTGAWESSRSAVRRPRSFQGAECPVDQCDRG